MDNSRADHLKDHRWKPGQSGNPGGRPKGTVDLWSRIRRELLRRSPDGREVADLIARLVVREALKGEWRVLRELLKHNEVAEGETTSLADLISAVELEDSGGESDGSDDH